MIYYNRYSISIKENYKKMQERQTKQKQIIYEALQMLDHPTATEVYGYVHTKYPTVSRATVFRVLGGFAANGRALELRAAGNEVRYDFNIAPHYHAYCRGCGRLADVKTVGFPECDVHATARGYFALEGFSLEFFGICKECQIRS